MELKYFVLKPRSGDSGDSRAHAAASREAMRAYANAIDDYDLSLAAQLREWADREENNAGVSAGTKGEVER